MSNGIGFDLTAIGRRPDPRPQQPQQQPEMPRHLGEYEEEAKQQVASEQPPMTMEEALTAPLEDVDQSMMVDEGGGIHQDKLKSRNPQLHKELWQVDKFAAKPRPVQRVIDGKKIWVDAGGNHVLDPDTGSVQLKAPVKSGTK